MATCSGCNIPIDDDRRFEMYVGPFFDDETGKPVDQTPTVYYLCPACETRWRSMSEPKRWVTK